MNENLRAFSDNATAAGSNGIVAAPNQTYISNAGRGVDSKPWVIEDGPIHVSLTHHPLDVQATISFVKNPRAGAVVLFAGTTRDNTADQAVASLSYTTYPALALRTMQSIASSMLAAHGLTAVSITHRLGLVPVEEESILVAVSAPHRQAAWKGGEEALEMCKRRLEVWKNEVFEDGSGGWQANQGVSTETISRDGTE
ncbi:MAG: Molybdopterin synthase catalytic subunit [Piccolia ochrophora]|nr:MAG: Molybdopterin synthase catalytic subunit [Piccolia ochrophora]